MTRKAKKDECLERLEVQKQEWMDAALGDSVDELLRDVRHCVSCMGLTTVATDDDLLLRACLVALMSDSGTEGFSQMVDLLLERGKVVPDSEEDDNVPL